MLNKEKGERKMERELKRIDYIRNKLNEKLEKEKDEKLIEKIKKELLVLSIRKCYIKKMLR